MSRHSTLQLLNSAAALTTAARGAANGVASLDASTLVPVAQLPDIPQAKVTDLESSLASKITAPATGSTGQVLTKTATGVAWADGGGGGVTAGAKVVHTAETLADFDALRDWCQENPGHAVLVTPSGTDWWDTYPDVKQGLNFGHTYLMFGWDEGAWDYAFSKFCWDLKPVYWVIVEITEYFKVTGGTAVQSSTTHTLTPLLDPHYDGTVVTTLPTTQTEEQRAMRAIGSGTVEMSVDGRSDYKAIIQHTQVSSTDWRWMVSFEEYDTITGTWQFRGYSDTASIKYDNVLTKRIGYDSRGPEPVYQEFVNVLMFDVTPGFVIVKYKNLGTGNARVDACGPYYWKPSSDATLSGQQYSSDYWGSCEIDIVPGNNTITAGFGLTLVDDLTANKINHCLVSWRGDKARLYVVDTEDAPAEEITVSYSGTTLTLNNVDTSYEGTTTTLDNPSSISYSGTTVTI